MQVLVEQAKLTSKGQITLPKSIRQALGVTTGARLRFELRGDEVVVTRAQEQHSDPAIGAFLALLEADIRQGQHIGILPDELALAMQETLGQPLDLDQEIEGDVAL